MIQQKDKYLIKLKDSIEQEKLQLIREKISKFAKFFFDIRTRTYILYDGTAVYFLSEEETKITDLGKQYPIVQLCYNPVKKIMLFLNHDGNLLAHFVNQKTQFLIKKDVKKESIFGWVYNRDNVDLFIAEAGGIRLMKIDQEKKNIKQVKSISGKYNSFLFEPNTQVLVCFPTGDCKYVTTFMFDDELKSKNWFKGPQVQIGIDNDDHLKLLAKKNKSLGLSSSKINFQLFHKQQLGQFTAETIHLNQRCYIVFYYGNQGKLKLIPISEQPQKQIMIKLPSDCLPTFVVIDNMLVIHLKHEKITFIYDINGVNAQMLVSPFPLEHSTRHINPYLGVFYGKRHIMPDGNISKWTMNVSAIYNYLKNQVHIFQFLIKRQKAKSDMIKWLRQNLLSIKHVNLSKFWKHIFSKQQSNIYKQRDLVTLSQVYANIFYTLYNDQLTPKEPLLSIVLQCIRQAKEMQVKIPNDLQKLLFDLLLLNKKYQVLIFLCHNDVIKDNQQLVQILMRKALKENQEILLTLAIDMANRICKPQKVFQMLILSQNVWLARRYLKQNFQHIQILYMLYASKGIRDLRLRQQYLKLTRSLILRKNPAMSQKYLNQAQQQMRKVNQQKQDHVSTTTQSQKPANSQQASSPLSPSRNQARKQQQKQN